MTSAKSVALTKDEVNLLITLVESDSAVTSRTTNASNNLKKEEAWKKITDLFNGSIISGPRKPEQLRLKWENLKKAARKRSTRIRMNNLKTGGGKPDYIPQDDAIDRVASLLGATCEGYTVVFGGDGDQESIPICGDENKENSTMRCVVEEDNGSHNIDVTVGDGDVMFDVLPERTMLNDDQRNFTFQRRVAVLQSRNEKSQMKQTNLALPATMLLQNITFVARGPTAWFYCVKKRKMELEIEKVEIDNSFKKKKDELELEKLELQNKKLKLELGTV